LDTLAKECPKCGEKRPVRQDGKKYLEVDPPVILPKLEVVQVSRTGCGELEIFDTRRTLISIFGMLLGVSVMSAVIIGFGYGIELLLSIFR